MGAYCTFNVFTISLSQIEFVVKLGPNWIIFIQLIIFVIAFILLTFIEKFQSVSKFAFVFLSILIIASLGMFLWERYLIGTYLAQVKLPANLSFPKFQSKPNVYVISFDALIPEAITKKFLGIEKLAYTSILEQNEFRVLKNVFADRVPTLNSINSMVAMDLSYFDSTPSRSRFLFDTAEIPAPFYEIFKRNDYNVQFTYFNSYFGQKKFSKLDWYDYFTDLGICAHVSTRLALLGYCLSSDKKLVTSVKQKESRKEYLNFLLKRIKKVAKSQEPWLTVAYIYSPGHTKLEFDYTNQRDIDEYANEFRDERAPEAANYISELIQTIRHYDPTAILIIFGDHGAYLLRTFLSPKVLPERKIEQTDLFQVAQAVLIGVYPKSFCPQEFGEPYSTARIGRSIVKCLSGGQDPLPAAYQVNDDHYLKYKYE